jgi:hypothetical protein
LLKLVLGDESLGHPLVYPPAKDFQAGSAYVKTTPVTAPVAVALPIARIPFADNVMPSGSAGPDVETPNVPPLATPFGSVADKSKVEALPAEK